MSLLGVDFWRGERISFPTSRVFRPLDTDLPDAIRREVNRPGYKATAIDLFCGAGGLSLGLEQSGFNVFLGADSDPTSCETHAHALRGVTVQANLSRPLDLLRILRSAGVRHVDLVAGGPPCQPFSRAGRSKIRDLERKGRRPPDRRPQLWLAFLRFVAALSPDFVLMENVPDLVLWDGGQTLRQICGSLEHRGYRVQARVLDCWRQGVPQHRKRLFVLASRQSVAWPPEDEVFPTLRDAIGDLPVVGPAHREYRIAYNGGPDTLLQRRLRSRGATRVTDHVTRDVRVDDRRAFALMRQGRRYAELPKSLRRYRADIFDDKYHLLAWDELSRSITAHIAKDGYWYIHPDAERMLSIREAARLQTFPDRFRFAGYPSDRFRQIGNAVPPEVARRLGRSMVAAMAARTVSGGEISPFRAAEFRRRLLAWHGRRAREYPWRRSMDPWLVLAAEMLLRRTRADMVNRIWPDFWRRFPNPRRVARNPRLFRETLRPLGLRWRVENMLDLATVLVRDHAGRVPTDRDDLMRLPGVGDYVADAVRAFALGERAVLVDANTARVASRVFGLPIEWTSLRNLNLRASVARLGGVRPPTPDVNLALLDLGGTVCVPGRPRCEICPVRALCVTGLTAATAPLPAP